MRSTAYLHVGENLFTGVLPDLSMPALKYLNVSYNSLTGNIPSSIANLAVLDTLDLSNQASTVYDPSTGIRVTRGLTGQIPPEIGQVGFVQTLFLQNNLLTGTMPDSLARLSYLGSLNLESNLIGGQIPASINILEQLGSVMLARNRLTGQIPDLGGSADVVRTVTMSGNPELLMPAPFKLCDLDDLDLRSNSDYCPAERSALAVSRDTFAWTMCNFLTNNLSQRTFFSCRRLLRCSRHSTQTILAQSGWTIPTGSLPLTIATGLVLLVTKTMKM